MSKAELIAAIRAVLKADKRISANQAYDRIGGDRALFKHAFVAVLVELDMAELPAGGAIHSDFAHLVSIPAPLRHVSELDRFAESHLARLDRSLAAIRDEAKSLLDEVCRAARKAVYEEQERYAGLAEQAQARADAAEDHARDVLAQSQATQLALVEDRDSLRTGTAVLEARVRELERVTERVEAGQRRADEQARSATQALERAAKDTSQLTRALGETAMAHLRQPVSSAFTRPALKEEHRRKRKGRFRSERK
jgi:hypothetical protein